MYTDNYVDYIGRLYVMIFDNGCYNHVFLPDTEIPCWEMFAVHSEYIRLTGKLVEVYVSKNPRYRSATEQFMVKLKADQKLIRVFNTPGFPKMVPISRARPYEIGLFDGMPSPLLDDP